MAPVLFPILEIIYFHSGKFTKEEATYSLSQCTEHRHRDQIPGFSDPIRSCVVCLLQRLVSASVPKAEETISCGNCQKGRGEGRCGLSSPSNKKTVSNRDTCSVVMVPMQLSVAVRLVQLTRHKRWLRK